MDFKLFFVVLLNAVLANKGNPVINDFDSNNAMLMNSSPDFDTIGSVSTILDLFLSRSSISRPPPSKEMCRPRTVKFGGFELQISAYPLGFCNYCCPLHNPSQYVRLYFTNKSKAGRMEQLKLGKKLPGMLRSAGINGSLNTVIFIHGFCEHGLGPSPVTVRDAYLSKEENINVILVDWGHLSTFPWYPQAVQNTKLVAAVVAKFIKFYSDTGELPISKIHVIGFSLGAHIAGFIGKFFKGPERFSRITGLDPARPLFPLDDPSNRISAEDAEYVDIIHTDGGKFGFPISIGHADFYPNGGRFIQPGCEVSSLTEQSVIQQLGTCSHLRAWQFYVESVKNPKAFPATKCGIMDKGLLRECRFITEGYMGFAANKSTTIGNFYLTTNKENPYSKSASEQEIDVKRINMVL